MNRITHSIAKSDTALLEMIIMVFTFRLGFSMFTPVRLFGSEAYYLVALLFPSAWVFGIAVMSLAVWWVYAFVTYREQQRKYSMFVHASLFLLLSISTMIASVFASPAWSVYMILALFSALVYRRLKRVAW